MFLLPLRLSIATSNEIQQFPNHSIYQKYIVLSYNYFRWANQCLDHHDKNRSTDKFSYVGQNKASSKYDRYSKTMKQITEQLIGYWYAEVIDLCFLIRQCLLSKMNLE